MGHPVINEIITTESKWTTCTYVLAKISGFITIQKRETTHFLSHLRLMKKKVEMFGLKWDAFPIQGTNTEEWDFKKDIYCQLGGEYLSLPRDNNGKGSVRTN